MSANDTASAKNKVPLDTREKALNRASFQKHSQIDSIIAWAEARGKPLSKDMIILLRSDEERARMKVARHLLTQRVR